jgi:polyisoprenoid-binding protein YceI
MRGLSAGVLIIVATVATGETYRIDVEHSRVWFDASSTLHDFTGRARLVRGAVRLEEDKPAGSIEADATSMDTGNDKRDRTMHGDIMATKRFPTIRFDLRSWRKDGDRYQATGTWTMHGVSREITVPVTVSEGDDPHARSDFTIDFREFDVPIPRVLVVTVAPTVAVHVDLALVLDRSAEVTAAPERTVGGMRLPGRDGNERDLATLAGKAIVLVDHRSVRTGNEWVRRLAKEGVAAGTVMRVLDLSRADRDDAEHARKRLAEGEALIDQEGAFRKRLGLSKADIQVVVLGVGGKLVGSVAGEADASAVKRVLDLLGSSEPRP